MTEAELAALIIRECGRRGLLIHHCKDSRHCEGTPGLPDLIIAGFRGVVFAELKSQDGETSADQDLWGYTLYRISRSPMQLRYLRYYVWRPEHWERDEIQAVLRSLLF